MIWAGVGSGGTLLDWMRVVSHNCEFLVALHACWMDGADVADDLSSCRWLRLRLWFRVVAEEGRLEKMRRESRERRKREDMAMKRNFEVGFVGFLLG